MLVQFSVENFMSFETETTFSMRASPSDTTHPDHVCEPGHEKGGPLLRAAALYGANASGKSNLIKAIAFARNLVVEGTRYGDRLYPQPFRLSDAREKPSRFQFIFRTEGILYEYGFVLDNERIHEEWLFGTQNTPRAKEKKFFERTTDEKGKSRVEFGAGLKIRGEQDKQFLQFIAQGTRGNQLLLPETAGRDVTPFMPVFEWFIKLFFVSPDAVENSNPSYAFARTGYDDYLSLLQSAGTNISKITTKKVPIDFDKEYHHLPLPKRKSIRDGLAQSRRAGGEFTYIQNAGNDLDMLAVDEEGVVSRIETIVERTHKNGEAVVFAIDEESDGTRRLLYLLLYLKYLQQVTDAVVLIDELDRRLHTLLSRTFLQLALSGPNRNCQLIFTTHDTNLLDLDLLRRDEIWFVEKDNGGASQLYRLAEFKIRPDLKIEKGYLSGRFGAIPLTGN